MDKTVAYENIMEQVLFKSGKLESMVQKYKWISQELNLITPPDYFSFCTKKEKYTQEEIKDCWIKAIAEEKVDEYVDLYVGIPYCEGPERCSYCMYYSKTSACTKEIDTYIDKLRDEMNDFSEIFKKPFNALYVGGGTPNILTSKQMDRLLNHITSKFDFIRGAEKTYENSPSLYSFEKMKLLEDYGINRISFGIQSFDEQVLNKVRRKYIAPQRMNEILEECLKMKFKIINVDLMIGLEGQTVKNCIDSFRLLANMNPTSITVYVNRHLHKQFIQINQKDIFLENYYTEMVYPAIEEIYNLVVPLGYVNLTNSKTLEYQIFVKKDCLSILHRYNTRRYVKDKNSCLGIGSNSISYINSIQNAIEYKAIKDPDKFNLKEPIFKAHIIENMDIMRLYMLDELYRNKKTDIKMFKKIFKKDMLEVFKFEIVCLKLLKRLNISKGYLELRYDTNKEFGIYGKFFYNPIQIQAYESQLLNKATSLYN